jgi:hypothetical protein
MAFGAPAIAPINKPYLVPFITLEVKDPNDFS